MVTILTTTPSVEGRSISTYLAVVAGDSIVGAGVFSDIAAGLTDLIGGRSRSYEEHLRKAREAASHEMIAIANKLGADAIVGVSYDYETIGGSMLMVCVTGTAVQLAVPVTTP